MSNKIYYSTYVSTDIDVVCSDDIFDTLELIKKFVKDTKECSVLDVGCNSGHDSRKIGKFFKFWHGIDNNVDSINYANTKLNEHHNNIKYSFVDANSIKSENVADKYDIIIFNYSLHFLNFKKWFSLHSFLLKPSSIIVCVEPIYEKHVRNSNIANNTNVINKKLQDMKDCINFITNYDESRLKILYNENNKYIAQFDITTLYDV